MSEQITDKPVRAQVRRIRTAAARAEVQKSNQRTKEAEAESSLKLISELDAQIAELLTQREGEVSNLRGVMESMPKGVRVVAYGLDAGIVDVKSRRSEEIDVDKLREFLDKKGMITDFDACVKVQIGALKKIISAREYDELPKTVVESKVTGQDIEIKKVKTPKSK